MSNVLFVVRCFIVRRRDGIVLGFTEHDSAITVDSVSCEPHGLVEASSVERTLGGSVDSTNAVGVFDSDRLAAVDLRAGKYIGAKLEHILVNWKTDEVVRRDPTLVVAETTEVGQVWKIEFETFLAQEINRVTGYIMSRTCSAVFGDARCGYDASSTARTITITATDGESWFEADTGAPTLGTWVGGRMIRDGDTFWLTGRTSSDSGKFSLRDTIYPDLEVGESVVLYEGCELTMQACKAFSNVVNFRGFPHMPGVDAISSYANKEDLNDGGSRFD